MKKHAAFVLAMAMAAVCAAPAMAEGNTQITPDTTSKSGDTTVTFTIDPAYTVTIPGTVTLDKNEGEAVTYEKDLTLTASNVRLEKGKELHITISEANDYKLTAAGGAELAYTIDDKTPGTTDVVATFETKAADQTQKLHIKAADPTYAGNYSGTLTFAIAVADATT